MKARHLVDNIIAFFEVLYYSSNNIINVTREYAKLINFKVSYITIRKFILNHPQSYSLVAMYDFFEYYGITVMSAKANTNQLDKVKTPFVAVLDYGTDNYFTIVKRLPLLTLLKTNGINGGLEI